MKIKKKKQLKKASIDKTLIVLIVLVLFFSYLVVKNFMM